MCVTGPRGYGSGVRMPPCRVPPHGSLLQMLTPRNDLVPRAQVSGTGSATAAPPRNNFSVFPSQIIVSAILSTSSTRTRPASGTPLATASGRGVCSETPGHTLYWTSPRAESLLLTPTCRFVCGGLTTYRSVVVLICHYGGLTTLTRKTVPPGCFQVVSTGAVNTSITFSSSA